jgi:hypothetical protein
METYEMSLVPEDAELVIKAVNQGIDSRLQAVTDSSFKWVRVNDLFPRLECTVSPNDLGVILRRLLEDGGEEEYLLASAIAYTLSINEIWLTTDDYFYITLFESVDDDRDDDLLEAILDCPYISIFDDEFWPKLLAEVQ